MLVDNDPGILVREPLASAEHIVAGDESDTRTVVPLRHLWLTGSSKHARRASEGEADVSRMRHASVSREKHGSSPSDGQLPVDFRDAP